MSYMRHHAIVVCSWKGEALRKAHAYAEAIFPWVSPISPETVNGYASFFVPPDGSKEGWTESDDGDKRRDQFITHLRWLHSQSMWVSWVEVQFDDDDLETEVTRSSDDDAKEEEPCDSLEPA